MSKTKKIAILAIIAMVLTMMPVALLAADTDSNRIAGADRIGTALAVCEAGWDSADTVILAPADQPNLVDALAAAPLAGQEEAPILLTFKASLDADVKAKIAKLGAKTVYVVGAISDDVVAAVKAIDGVTVEKLAGADRIATAKAITAKLTKPAGTFVVGLEGLADALSVASYAAANNFAIAIANADGSIASADLVGDTTYIVGGTTRVANISGVTRFGGADRFETNAAVAKGLTFSWNKAYVANGLTLVDALSVAPLAAQSDSFVLLVSTTAGKAVEGMTASTQIIAVGGTNAVPQKVIDGLFGDDSGVFDIKSVKAPNLIQLTLTLTNTDYDKDELTEESNYDLEAIAKDDKSSSNIDVKKVDVDGKTVTLTLTEPIKNETTGTLTIDEGITGKELVFKDIKFSDHDIPTIKDVSVIGKDTVKFIFSEPIDDLANADDEFDFDLDGKSYSVKKVTPIKNGFEANVQVYSSFKEGTLTVKVGNGLEDYAGFNIIPKTFKVDVVPDTDAPVVTGYKDAKNKEVTLIFNEDIQFESKKAEDYYHTNSKNTVDSGSLKDNQSNPDDNSIDGNELKLSFSDNELPDGIAYVYIDSGSVSDLWGNENNSIRAKIEIDVDNVKPTVKKAEFKDGIITVTFSEKVDEKTAENTDNYTLVDEDGDSVSIVDATLLTGEKKVDLELRDNNPDAGIYELTIEKVEDQAGNRIDKVTVDVDVNDTDAINYPSVVYYDKSGTKTRLYLEFDKVLATSGSYSAADLNKYEVKAPGGAVTNLGKAEADDDYNSKLDIVDNGKTVRITTDYPFELESTKGSKAEFDILDTFQIQGRIGDTAGNYTSDASVDSLPIEHKANQTISIVGSSVIAKSKTNIELEFSGNLDNFDEGDFIVKSSSKTYEIADINVKSSKKIVLILDDDTKLPADVAGVTLSTRDQNLIKSENAYGIKLEGKIAPIDIIDEIAPSVLKQDDRNKNVAGGYDIATGSDDGVQRIYAEYHKDVGTPANSYSEITIVFDEAVDGTTLIANPSLFVVKKGGTSTKFTVGTVTVGDYDGKTGNAVTIKVTDGDVDGKVVKGDTIDIAIVYDKASTGANYTSNLQLKIQYPVPTI